MQKMAMTWLVRICSSFFFLKKKKITLSMCIDWGADYIFFLQDVAASAGGYYSFVQFLSWIISGQAGST